MGSQQPAGIASLLDEDAQCSLIYVRQLQLKRWKRVACSVARMGEVGTRTHECIGVIVTHPPMQLRSFSMHLFPCGLTVSTYGLAVLIRHPNTTTRAVIRNNSLTRDCC